MGALCIGVSKFPSSPQAKTSHLIMEGEHLLLEISKIAEISYFTIMHIGALIYKLATVSLDSLHSVFLRCSVE